MVLDIQALLSFTFKGEGWSDFLKSFNYITL